MSNNSGSSSDPNGGRKSTTGSSVRGGGRNSTTGSSVRGRGSWRPYNRPWNNYNRQSAPKEKPVQLLIPSNATSQQQNFQLTSRPGSSSTFRPSGSGPSSSDQPPITLHLDKLSGEYPTWKLYHPEESFMEGSKTVRRIRSFEKHFKANPTLYSIPEISKTSWFPVVIQILLSDTMFCSDWPSFKQDLNDTPEHTLLCAGLAMHQLILQQNRPHISSFTLKTIKARIQGHGPTTTLKSLKGNTYGKMISVRGTVIRVGASQIACTWLAFKCSVCHTLQAIRQPEGIMTQPASCQPGCKSRSNFIPQLSSLFTKTETFQEVRLQESTLCDQYDSGRVPRSIEVAVSEDLVDSVCPGDDVTITGILKVKPQDEFLRKDQANIFKMYLQGVTILSNKNALNSRKAEYTIKDMEAIRMIQSEPDPFRLLVNSICPSIYGHEIVKAGLILGLFGGSGISSTNRRNEIHILVVGDPGLGKTQMLQACANVSPRGIFISGNSSTTAGLTVTVRHDRGTGSALEAGALVLADQGVCCIDEFDKMSSNQQPLLEVMEQQTVSIAKAGVLCTLPARTSILAAANPSGGHYDKSRTVSENLKIGPALLSRFDLVFIILDRPDEQHDLLITKHIQALHAKANRGELGPSSSKLFQTRTLARSQNLSIFDDESSLHERLKLKPNENLDVLPHILMQKYIGYARKNLNPKLSPEASQEIKKFYLELRQIQNGRDTIPVTIRQLEALIRVTQARARIDLSEIATLEHVKDVLEIFRQSMVDVFTTETGCVEMQRGINGSGISQTAQIRKFVKILESRSLALQKTIFSVDEIKTLMGQNNIRVGSTHLIDTLNNQGYLLKKGMHLYKLVID